MECSVRRFHLPHAEVRTFIARAALGVLVTLLVSSPLRAQDATILDAGPPADCTIVGIEAVSRILGYSVGEPDEASRVAGICTFNSRAVSEEGGVTYALVTAQRLPARRAFFITQARRCAGVTPAAPRAPACKTFLALAAAADLDAYFAARTEAGDATAIQGLGDAAFVTSDALYVRRAATVYEVTVRRGDALDVERSTNLAKLLLARTP